MKFIIYIINLLASIITICSAVGLWGIPEKLQDFGIQEDQLQITFWVSLAITILLLLFGIKIGVYNISGDKKTQIQFGGKNNKQDMS